jgi:tetratricopeptide (TPR) repeat protein
LETFENELDINPELNRNVELYAELNEALQENDIIDIREKLGKVIQSQHSSTWSLEEVDAFVNGEMPENEREAFIAEMADNDDLRAEVNLSKSLNKAFEEKDIHHLRKELEIIAQEMKQLSANSLIMLPDKHRKMRRNGTYAAVVIALIGLSSVFWQNDNSSKSRYDEFFKMPQTVSSLRSVGTIYNEVMSKGFELYNKSEYVSALPYFEKVLQTDKTNPIAHYWAGLTNRQMQRYPDALLHFQQVINHHNNLCVEQAEWFSILCMIKMSRVASVISPLNAIIDRKGYYYKEALTLRSKILKND